MTVDELRAMLHTLPGNFRVCVGTQAQNKKSKYHADATREVEVNIHGATLRMHPFTPAGGSTKVLGTVVLDGDEEVL